MARSSRLRSRARLGRQWPAGLACVPVGPVEGHLLQPPREPCLQHRTPGPRTGFHLGARCTSLTVGKVVLGSRCLPDGSLPRHSPEFPPAQLPHTGSCPLTTFWAYLPSRCPCLLLHVLPTLPDPPAKTLTTLVTDTGVWWRHPQVCPGLEPMKTWYHQRIGSAAMGRPQAPSVRSPEPSPATSDFSVWGSTCPSAGCCGARNGQQTAVSWSSSLLPSQKSVSLGLRLC